MCVKITTAVNCKHRHAVSDKSGSFLQGRRRARRGHSFLEKPAADMPAMGIAMISTPGSSALILSNDADRRSPPTPFLGSSSSRSLSSFFHVSGCQQMDLLRKAVAGAGRGKECFGGRSPIVVFPKAVSDSRSSQTCLDPDASRVSVTSFR